MSADRWPIDPTRGIASVLTVGRTSYVYGDYRSPAVFEASTISPINSHIDFHLLGVEPIEGVKEKIDRVAAYLKANPNIKTLTVQYYALLVEASTYLLRTLADISKAGDQFDSLRITAAHDVIEPGLLEQHLRRIPNLTRLDIKLEPAALQFVTTTLATSNVAHLCLELGVFGWAGQLIELGTRLAQCNSVESLHLSFTNTLCNDERHAEVKRFFQAGVAKMRSLSHVELSFSGDFEITSLLLNAIGSLVHECGKALDHFAINITPSWSESPENTAVSWRALGVALASVKSLSFRGQVDLCMVLPQLESCESLHLGGIGAFKSLGAIVSRFPALRTFTVTPWKCGFSSELLFDDFVSTIKASDSITEASVLEVSRWIQEPPNFRDEVDLYCLLNRVFGTTLIGYGPTELWARVLSKVPSDSLRAALLYRLLREKPELLACCTHFVPMSNKRQKCENDSVRACEDRRKTP